MGRRPPPFEPHALSRLVDRCHIRVDPREAVSLLRTAERVLNSSTGEWLLVEWQGFYAVLIRRDGIVRTALTLEHAFADCPKGLFMHLLRTSRLVVALNLRAMYVSGQLPVPHGTDDGNYKYHKRQADFLWRVFAWKKST